MGIADAEFLSDCIAIGELALDGRIIPSPGVLLAALHASEHEKTLICPAAQGSEATWAPETLIIAAPNLISLLNHIKGTQILPQPTAGSLLEEPKGPDLKDIKGQETAKRALEIAAAGGHNLLLCGPPGAGKSMLASCLPGILPDLTPIEALEVSLIASITGTLQGGQLKRTRPFRTPHHSASMAALTGGGAKARPGEISLAHNGVLFLDELPEFQRSALDSLRQPLETGQVSVARAAAHLTYPARVQLIAAMNPCRCGHMNDPALACSRAPKCAVDYQNRISGPLLDRIDLHIEVDAVRPHDLATPATGECSQKVAARVQKARHHQTQRLQLYNKHTNAELDGELLSRYATPDQDGQFMLLKAAEKLHLSARAYTRILRVARTIADLDDQTIITRPHIAEALALRLQPPRA